MEINFDNTEKTEKFTLFELVAKGFTRFKEGVYGSEYILKKGKLEGYRWENKFVDSGNDFIDLDKIDLNKKIWQEWREPKQVYVTVYLDTETGIVSMCPEVHDGIEKFTFLVREGSGEKC